MARKKASGKSASPASKKKQPIKPPEPQQQADRLATAAEIDPQPRLPFPVVGMGASAGGLEAFSDFFKKMPTDSGMAFVLIQHLPPERDSILAEILGKRTKMPVFEVKDGMEVKPNHVYIIRPGHTLTIQHGHLHLGESLEKPGHRRPVDDFFRSLAEEQRQRAICVVMSGMGSNGTAGAQSVKAVGGLCIAQDPENAKFPVMPRSLIDSGMADMVLTAEEIPQALLRYAAHPYASESLPADDVIRRDREGVHGVLAILRARTRHDFTGYKKPTLVRRIQRRMGLNQITDIAQYARLLRQNPSEVTALLDDLTIHVTGFFRDPEAWEMLREQVINPLVAGRSNDEPIRAWVTACSSGEEAYSLVMILLETAEEAQKHFDIKVFATDTAERSLMQARSGSYPGGIESDVSPQRLARFFDKEEATYRIKKEIRELVVFAPQNVLRDPPFSRLDLCTCRNLLIYLEPDLQRRILLMMHFGLRENGVLFLGNSETVCSLDDIFKPIDKKWRIYRRIGPTRHGSLEFLRPQVLPGQNEPHPDIRNLPRAGVAQLANRILLDQYTPPSVVVDREFRILYFHGRMERFLDQPRGEPTQDLITLAHESVRGAVRTALHKAMSGNEAATARAGISGKSSGRRRVEITVRPLNQHPARSYFLVSFFEHAEPAPIARTAAGESAESQRQLERELQRVHDELQSTIEELQTSNEEMKASNEEITSINEELQSTNEELETSKEELQSLNEELTTVNAQLSAKMEELEHTTNDLGSLLSSTDIAVVFLDMQFRIRRFTPAVKDLFDLIPSDVGRPLNDLARRFTDRELLSDAQHMLDKLVPIQKEVSSESGRDYIRRVLPYRTSDNRIDGVVITFIDITDLKRAEADLRESEERHRLILEGITEYAILMLDPQGNIALWTPSAERMFRLAQGDAIGKPMLILYPPGELQINIARQQFEQGPTLGNTTAVEEQWHSRGDGTRFWGSGSISVLKDSTGSLRGYVKVVRDNTSRRRAEENLRQAKHAAEAANEAKDQFLANVSHELRTPLSAILLWAKMLEGKSNVQASQLQEGVSAIRRSAEAQKELIEDLLDTARIASGKLRLELSDVPLVPILEGAVDAIRPAAGAKHIIVKQEFDAGIGTVHVDPHRVQQVLWNLLSNAVKFTPEDGHISVAARRSGQSVEIQVQDSGQGIDTEQLPHIFERFFQSESSTTRSKGGMGLGLAISKQLVEMHGGTISIHSEGKQRGSTVKVRLPLPSLAAGPKDGDHATAKLARSLVGIRVLLVEDEADMRDALVISLREAGAEVLVADSAASALEQFKSGDVDVIVSDIGLPQIDGNELLRKIRKMGKKNNGGVVPAVALTAYVHSKDRQRAMESGYQRFLAKPAEPMQLVSAILALVSKEP